MDQQCRIGQVVVVGEGDNQLEPPEAKERCFRVWKSVEKGISKPLPRLHGASVKDPLIPSSERSAMFPCPTLNVIIACLFINSICLSYSFPLTDL